MLEVINTLRQVETGVFRGIGKQLVALGDKVVLPTGLTQPEKDSGLGIISRYLSSSALETVQDCTINLFSPYENGKIVDKRLLAWLLIGREQANQTRSDGLGSEQFVFSAEKIITRAIGTATEVAKMKIVQGGKKSVTNWRSLFEGLVKADIFGNTFQPTIITSLGGFDGKTPLAAPFNIVPGLELSEKLRENGYNPKLTVTSAAKYGVDCNGIDSEGAQSNWNDTFRAYMKLAKNFYSAAEASTSYETLWPGGLGAYPEELIRAARICCEADEGLRQTAEQYGAGSDAFVSYMLSHIQAFRDYQIVPEAPYVIKVGAPSELRFSRWQKLAIEQALPLQNGYVPNMVLNDNTGKANYGQVSLYYPRLGNRPPYYPDSDNEPMLYGKYPTNFEDFLWSIPDVDTSLRRYADLQEALEVSSVKPNEYLELFSGGLK